MLASYSKDWCDDCYNEWGEILTGKFAHWCPDCDLMPIDETCKQFELCSCYPSVEGRDFFPERAEGLTGRTR